MSEFRVQINTDNAAFEDDGPYELQRILRGLADRVSQGEPEGTLRDVNGNTVGKFYTVED